MHTRVLTVNIALSDALGITRKCCNFVHNVHSYKVCLITLLTMSVHRKLLTVNSVHIQSHTDVV